MWGIVILTKKSIIVRPPGIYKADYLRELYSRYDDVDDTPPPPNLPDWCFENNEAPEQQNNHHGEQASSSKYVLISCANYT